MAHKKLHDYANVLITCFQNQIAEDLTNITKYVLISQPHNVTYSYQKQDKVVCRIFITIPCFDKLFSTGCLKNKCFFSLICEIRFSSFELSAMNWMLFICLVKVRHCYGMYSFVPNVKNT